MDLFNTDSEVKSFEASYNKNSLGNARVRATLMGSHVNALSDRFPKQDHANLEAGPDVFVTLRLKGVFLVGAHEEAVAEGQTPFTQFGLGATSMDVILPESSGENASDESEDTATDVDARKDEVEEANAAEFAKLRDENTELLRRLDQQTTDTNDLNELRGKNTELEGENAKLANRVEELERELDELTAPPENKDAGGDENNGSGDETKTPTPENGGVNVGDPNNA